MPGRTQSAFLGDENSQILALADALLCAHGPAIAGLFNEVARLRGLAQLARDAKIDPDTLHKAIADPQNPDLSMLGRVVEALQKGRRL